MLMIQGINTISKPNNNLRGKLVKVKDKTPKNIISNVVYSFTCQNDWFQANYIGETKQTFKSRVSHHRRPSTGDTYDSLSLPTWERHCAYWKYLDARQGGGLVKMRGERSHLGKDWTTISEQERRAVSQLDIPGTGRFDSFLTVSADSFYIDTISSFTW